MYMYIYIYICIYIYIYTYIATKRERERDLGGAVAVQQDVGRLHVAVEGHGRRVVHVREA